MLAVASKSLFNVEYLPVLVSEDEPVSSFVVVIVCVISPVA